MGVIRRFVGAAAFAWLGGCALSHGDLEDASDRPDRRPYAEGGSDDAMVESSSTSPNDPDDPEGLDVESEGGSYGGSSGEDDPPEDVGPHPIVLAHGFFGFDDFAGLGFVHYFYGVREELAARGETLVFTPTVDPFNDSTIRGLQLLEQVEAIVQTTGATKVNLVAHSQGGLDARVVAHLRPDLVASVTTIATPHHGTEVADVVLGLVTSDLLQRLADDLVKLVGGELWGDIDDGTSVSASMQQMSSPGMAMFNAEYPNAPGVTYFSIAGRSDRHRGEGYCESEEMPGFIAAHQVDDDPIDALLAVAETIVQGGSNYPIPNDGLVNVPKSKWGRFLGCIPADHLDEVGHLFGDLPGSSNAWEHRLFFADLVGFLRDQGF